MSTQLVVAVVGLALAPAAMAQWSDNFDSYPAGSINGQGGWQGWDGAAGAAGVVTSSISRSAHNSQQVNGAADSVHQYSGITAGQWSYVAWQYIPHDFAGDSYFILNNDYANGGPYNWAVQIKFAGSGTLNEDMRTGSTINYIRSAWAEIRIDFDLTANTVSEYYNGTLFASGTWAAAGPVSLEAVDLFANNASNIYYDDMSVTRVPAPASLALLGLGAAASRRRRR
jgi:hypothetical protein